MDKIKIAIDAGHGANTAGKRTPSGYREHWSNVIVANYCYEGLIRCGFEVLKVAWDDANGKDDYIDVPLAERQKMIKDNGCQYSASIHFNAFGNGVTYNSAQGVVTYASNIESKVGDSIALANAVQSQLIQGTKQNNRGVKTSDFAMVNCKAMGTKASILVECAFMTNEYEESLMKSDIFCQETGEEIVKGFCKYLNVPYIPLNAPAPTPKPEVPSSDTLYCVQVGAFRYKSNADKMLKQLEDAGFDGYITIKQK